MRLIDGNKALREVERIPFIANENKAFHEGCRYMQKKVLRIFHESKAIEAEPMRHGEWIKTEQQNACAVWTDFKCPVCGSVFNGNERLFDKWAGCPVCLTKMDGGNA